MEGLLHFFTAEFLSNDIMFFSKWDYTVSLDFKQDSYRLPDHHCTDFYPFWFKNSSCLEADQRFVALEAALTDGLMAKGGEEVRWVKNNAANSPVL